MDRLGSDQGRVSAEFQESANGADASDRTLGELLDQVAGIIYARPSVEISDITFALEQRVLEMNDGNVLDTSKRLGIGRSTLWRHIEKKFPELPDNLRLQEPENTPPPAGPTPPAPEKPPSPF